MQTLTPIGDTITTYDGQAQLLRTWRVTGYAWNPYVGRQVALVVLEHEESAR